MAQIQQIKTAAEAGDPSSMQIEGNRNDSPQASARDNNISATVATVATQPNPFSTPATTPAAPVAPGADNDGLHIDHNNQSQQQQPAANGKKRRRSRGRRNNRNVTTDSSTTGQADRIPTNEIRLH